MRPITREKIKSAIGRFVLPELNPSWRDLPAITTLEIGKKSEGFRYYSILKYRGITYRKVTYVIPGPTSGLNADDQHDHIRDTVIPTFIHFNIPLLIFGWIAAMVL